MIQKLHLLNQDMWHISVHPDLFEDCKISLSPSKKKLSSPLLFAELKEALGAKNVAKSQNLHNGASAVYNLRLNEAIGVEDDFYDKTWVLALNTSTEMWRLRCHCLEVEVNAIPTTPKFWDVGQLKTPKTLWSRKHVVDWVQDVLFKDYSPYWTLMKSLN